MIPVAKNLEEAKTFFLENSHGTILCQREDGVERECRSYPEAEKFFNSLGHTQ